MRSCQVEVHHILIEHALELLLAEDQQMVKAFLSYTPQIAFADRIGSWCMKGRFENLNSTVFRHTSETGSELLSLSELDTSVLAHMVWLLGDVATQGSVGDRSRLRGSPSVT